MKRKIINIILAMLIIINIFPGDARGEEAKMENEEESVKVIDTRPYNREKYFDSERLKRSFKDPDEEGYYIEVVFDNIYQGEVLDMINMPDGISVKIEGEDGTSLEDGSKKLRFTNTSKEIRAYIPLREKPTDGQEYKVRIEEGLFIEYENPKRIVKNQAYEFTFKTNYMPKADRLYEGSLTEAYDYDYPIVVEGSSFHRNTRVEFKAMDGRIYEADDVIIRDGRKTLYIYLPRNRRLPVGTYDIIISNGRNYEIAMEYGVLSIVEEGKHMPEKDYKIKNENRLGTIKDIEGSSKSILELKKYQAEKDKLEINLDDLMDVDTWTRKIKYPSNFYGSIKQLVLKSRWANADIKELKIDRQEEEGFSFGRAEASLAENMKSQLVYNNVKSNFIEVRGGSFDSINIEIPYFQSDGKDLKIFRYDEETRKIEKIVATTDLVNQKLIGTSNKVGIFVVVD